jgi:hypothetical protein
MSRYPETDASSADGGSLLRFDALGEVLVGQNLLRFPTHGRVVAVAGRRGVGLSVRRRSQKISSEVDSPPELIGRGAELAVVMRALESSLPVELLAEPGGGKTAMLRQLAGARSMLRRRVVFMSWREEPVGDLLQRLFESSYMTDPHVKVTPGQLHQYLQELQAVVLLDDVSATPADVQVVMDSAPQCLFVFASEQELLWGEGRTVPLPGLTTDAALSLIEQRLQRSLGSGERSAAQSVCQALEGHPLRIVQAAALAREEGLSFGDVSEMIREAPARDALPAEIVSRLTERERRMLSVLTCLGGAPLLSELMARVTGLGAPTVTLNALVRRGLAEREGDRYRLAEPLPARVASALESEWWAERVLEQLTVWGDRAGDQRVRIVDEAEAVLWALRWGTAHSKWLFVLRLARAVEAPMALGARFEAWEIVLRSGLEAARALEDREAESLFLHQLGSRDLALGSTLSAEGDLTAALALSQDTGDERSMAATQHHLTLLEMTTRPEPPQTLRSYLPRRTTSAHRLSWTALKTMLVVLTLLVLASLLLLRNAPGKGVEVSATEVSFGEQAVGISRARDVAVHNAGTAQVSITIRQPGLPDFSVSSPSCDAAPLKGESSCSIRVAFKPTATGNQTTTLAIRATNAPTTELKLTGVGTPPANGSSIHFSHDSLTFGGTTVGNSRGQALTITNSGAGALGISAVSIEPDLSDFRIRSTCFSAPIAPRESCSVAVTFTPTAAGSRKAWLTINYNALGSPHVVPVSGVGLAAPGKGAARVSPSAVFFGDVSVGDPVFQPISLYNAGTGTLTIVGVAVDTRDFASVMCGPMPLRLSPGRTCSVGVTFIPRAQGQWTGTLTITETGGGLQAVPLEGIGVGAAISPAISLQPNPLIFSQQTVGTSASKTIIVRNGGSAPLRVSSVSSSSTSFAVQGGCSTVAPGKSCPLTVTFSPHAAGLVTGTISITDGAPGSPHKVGVRGTGILEAPLPPSLSPPSWDFGPLQLGNASGPKIIAVLNIGSVALTIQQPPAVAGAGFSIDLATTNCEVGTQLSAGTSCDIGVVFTPQSLGSAAGTLYVYDNAANSPQTVTLSGTGEPPPSP